MKKKRNAVILWKKRNNYGKNVMVGTSALTIITPAKPGHHKDAHGKQGKSYRYPFATPGSRETIVDKMPCLRAYALGGLAPPTLWLRGESTLHYTTVLPR